MSDDYGWEIDDSWIDNIEYPVEEYDPYQYIMGMDPGGTTGIAMLRIDTEDPSAKPELIYLHQIDDGRYGFKEFFHGSTIDHNLTVVSEKWRERNVKGANREPQYIEGGMHMLWGDENIEWQYPDVKDVITDDYLKKNNLWTPNHPHQMDALRHALAYLRNSGHEGTLDTMNPDGSGEPIAQPGDAEGAQLSEQSGGGEPGEPGEGGADGGKVTFADAVEAVQKATAEFGEAVEELGEAAGVSQAELEEFAKAVEQFDGPGGYGMPEEDTRKRTKRERNGAFAGYNPVDYEEGGTTLLDD